MVPVGTTFPPLKRWDYGYSALCHMKQQVSVERFYSAPCIGGSPAERDRGVAAIAANLAKAAWRRWLLWRLHGHALAGVRVQKVQRVQRFDTSFGREGCGGRLRRQCDAACGGGPLWCLHGHALAGVRVQKVQRVQRFDGPMARGLWWAPVAPV